MLTTVFFEIVNRSPKGRRIVFRKAFEYLARRSRHMTTWTQMNFGYADGSGLGHTIPLEASEEHERYCHQLYFRVVNGIDLQGKDVVEVSSGRGGGAAFVHRYLGPRTTAGIDIASGAINFCRRVHRSPQLRFLQGDAEDLPLFDESTDALINVEASFAYGDLKRFFSEVHRVLRPGGYFLYTDLHSPGSIDEITLSLQNLGFDVLRSDDISTNVLRALDLDADRRIKAVRANAPWGLRRAMEVFAGTPGSRIPAHLASGRLRYCCFTLRKGPIEAPTTKPIGRTEKAMALKHTT